MYGNRVTLIGLLLFKNTTTLKLVSPKWGHQAFIDDPANFTIFVKNSDTIVGLHKTIMRLTAGKLIKQRLAGPIRLLNKETHITMAKCYPKCQPQFFPFILH